MNQLSLALTAAWSHLPFYRLAADSSAAAAAASGATASSSATDQANLCQGLQAGDKAADCTGSTFAKNVHTITTTLLLVSGAVAVLIIIIGGLRYVISQGDATGVKQAKDTILYAVIGLVVVILAYAIVHFVTGSIGGSGH